MPFLPVIAGDLLEGDVIEQRQFSEAAVDKDEHDYAPIGWRRSSNRYTLTQQVFDLVEGRV